jgi:CheY-like chemotaxis protein/anti-sigma regulatory factor (Ser/Thr protein kinase)
MARVLVVDDSDIERQHIGRIIRNSGHDFDEVPDVTAALTSIRQRRPDIVLTDMQMPGMNGLDLVEILRAEFPGLPVVVCTGEGSEELAVQALKAGAAHYLPKRNLHRDTPNVLDELVSVSIAQRKQSLLQECLSSAEYTFTLENDPELASVIVSHVETVMRQMALFDPGEHVRIGVAVQEAVVNAVVHGNLEVSSALKTGDWEGYHDLIARRAKSPPYNQRRVTIIVRATREKCLIVRVRDQGKGFDPSTIPDPRDPANIGEASGRGLLLIRTFFDRVTHNLTGNEIMMEKGDLC